MDIAHISIVEIVAGALVGMVLGAFWYGPVGFGAAWMRSIGKTPETLGSQTRPMLGSMVACLLFIQSGCRVLSVLLMSVVMFYI
jgi:hypothetical protein